MSATAPYDPGFFRKIENGSLASARTVVPVLLELLRPKSVVDVGCGAGAWLSVVQENGVNDLLGIDGDYVDPKTLLIPPSFFLPGDVGTPLTVPRRFDLVLSLEVAEHIAPDHADAYLDNLKGLGDAIVFSAAIPNQTGTGHVNEQWPEYWKTRFEARGYVLIDCLRHRFWNNRNVERWYRQNLLLYVTESRLREEPVLLKELENARGRALSLVHPAMYVAPSLSAVIQMLPKTLKRAIRRRLGKEA